jgi:hypothetical protein
MKLLKHALMAAGGVLALAGAGAPQAMASPAPNYLGPTGYILTPNADVMEGGCLNTGYHFLDLSNPRVANPNISSGYVNAGLFDRAEIGGSALFFHAQPFPNDKTFKSRAMLNGKVKVFGPELAWPTTLAVGVMDATDSLFRTAYVVGQVDLSRYAGLPMFPDGLVVGAGWGAGNRWSPIDGVWVNGRFNPIDYTEAHGEWMSNTGLTNVGVRVNPPFAQGLALDFSAIDVTGVAGGWSPAIGASYTYCFTGRGGGGGGGDYDDEGGPAKGGMEKGGGKGDGKGEGNGMEKAPVSVPNPSKVSKKNGRFPGWKD